MHFHTFLSYGLVVVDRRYVYCHISSMRTPMFMSASSKITYVWLLVPHSTSTTPIVRLCDDRISHVLSLCIWRMTRYEDTKSFSAVHKFVEGKPSVCFSTTTPFDFNHERSSHQLQYTVWGQPKHKRMSCTSVNDTFSFHMHVRPHLINLTECCSRLRHSQRWWASKFETTTA